MLVVSFFHLSSNAIAVEQQSNNGEIVPGEVGCASGAFLENLGAEDLCLQLEDSCSNSSDDMNIISTDPAFNFKPPKKVNEILQRFSWLSKVVEEERGGVHQGFKAHPYYVGVSLTISGYLWLILYISGYLWL